MSYLYPLRLHFAGRFQAAVSTVNNDPTHFNNATFKPEYQKLSTSGHPNGWWNPTGDADWRFAGCRVTSAWQTDGTSVGKQDPILTYLIADSDRKVAAKLVDLDPQQQLVSAIWGLEVRICDEQGQTLLRASYERASFTDIWNRYPAGNGDSMAGATYQSVLSGLEWGNVEQSPFLISLKNEAKDGLLSIKFNVDGYNTTFKSAEFTFGRIVGTIGPATAAEPHHFIAGRQLVAVAAPTQSFFAPSGGINFCSAIVDPQTSKILLDLGNALPTTQPGGPLADIGTLSLVCENEPDTNGDYATWLNLGTIPYRTDNWYETTAGVVALPEDRSLTPDELTIIARNPLTLVLPDANNRQSVAITESPGGLHVRADQIVFYLSPDQSINISLFATQYGQPYCNAQIAIWIDSSMIQSGPDQPPVGVPLSAIEFPATVGANENGVATITIHAKDPGNPRGYIDGQVYGIRPVLLEFANPNPGPNPQYNPWNYISLLVWNAFTPDEPPTWWGSLQPIFQQYANLYPVMSRFIDLADYESVCEHLEDLQFAFGLESDDPNSMPVTRDLSPAKRKAILRWATSLGPDKKPLVGKSPNQTTTPSSQLVETSVVATGAKPANYFESGKAAAMKHRLAVQPVRNHTRPNRT